MKRWEREYLDLMEHGNPQVPAPQGPYLREDWRLLRIRRANIFYMDLFGIPRKEIAAYYGVTYQRIAEIIKKAKRQRIWED